MLVFGRKPEQTIVVGEVEFKILAIRGGKVRVGVTAPREMPIARGELVDQPNPHLGSSVDKTGA